jgi:hypothetical protein
MEPNELPEVKEALQKRDIEDLVKEVHEGFAGVHNRQDQTNGKVLKNIADINALQTWNEKQAIKDRYNKLIWYLLTVSLSTIVGLATYLLLHPK